MRKLLFFLALFGSGFAVLYFLESREAPFVDDESEGTEPLAGTETGTEQEGIVLGGAFQVSLYDPETGLVVLFVRSADSETVGEEDRFQEVGIDVFEPEGEAVQAHVDARTARIRREPGAVEYQPTYEKKIDLTEIDARVSSGVPLAPLSIRSPTAALDASQPGARQLESEDTIVLESAELDASGAGWYLNLDGEVIEFRRQGRVEFRRPGEALVRFSALEEGQLSIHRQAGPDPQPIEIEAWQGARLELEGGERSSFLDADHVQLRGLESMTDSDELSIESLFAEGGAVWSSGKNLFRGDTAIMEFDASGELVQARMEGLPSARMALRPSKGVVPDLPVEELDRIAVQGQSLMEITWAEETRFTVDGPATVEAEDFGLRSNGAVNGWMSLDERSAGFTASGGVVLESGRATLETAEFEVEQRTDDEGTRSMRGFARGGARLVGTLSDGRPFTLTTPDRLEVERVGERWRVIEATDVEISIEGDESFRARADRVTEFDPETLSLIAAGSIRLQNPRGEGQGETLQVFSRERFTLAGTPEKKATFTGPEGSAEAEWMEVDGGILRARGGVVAGFTSSAVERGGEGGVERYDLSCERLELERETELEGDEEVRRLRVEAEGSVDATIISAAETVELQSLRLSGTREERRVGDELRRASSTVVAEGQVHGVLERPDATVDLDCQRLDIRRAEGAVVTSRAVAAGEVRFVTRAQIETEGEGDLLTLDHLGNATLEAPLAGRVRLHGELPSNEAPYQLTASRVVVQGELVRADDPEILVTGMHARARELRATPESLELVGSVHLVGASPETNVPWTLDADEVRIEGEAEPSTETASLRNVVATGSVDLRVGATVRATGTSLAASGTFGTVRLTGEPARVEAPICATEAEWIELDPELQIITSTGKGVMLPVPVQDEEGEAQADAGWRLEFRSSRTLLEPDSLVYALQEPIFEHPTMDARVKSSWILFWIDRQRWNELPERLRTREGPEGLRVTAEDVAEDETEQRGEISKLFGFLEGSAISEFINEVYLEGPVEVFSDDDMVVRADALYLDVIASHGWLANATVNVFGRVIGQDFEKLVLKTDWMRISQDGSLRADSATVTPCAFDDPHLKVVTEDLQIIPIFGEDKPESFRLLLEENRIELYEWLTIPLPSLGVGTDEELNPLWSTLGFGNSARFGSFLSASITRPAGDVGKGVNDALGGDPKRYKARYRIDASYLGSRGGLLDLGFEMESKGDYWFDLYTGLVYDTGEDKGLIRVPEDDRNDLRYWIRSHGQYNLGDDQWLRLVVSDQSDAGVQSEFWEPEFLYYEQAETYVQWQKFSHEYLFNFTVQPRVDSFRTQVETLPQALIFRGRAPILDLGPVSLLHTGDVSFDYLRRQEGTDPVSPFGLPATFPDGLGDRETLRFETTHRFEVPVPLGDTGVKLTPFSSVQLAAWSEGQDPDDSPTRFLADAGVRLATTLWKRTEGGTVHQVIPFIEYRDSLVNDQHDGVPVTYSVLELVPLVGNFIEVGTRARLGVEDGRSVFDLELSGTYASDRSDGSGDGWLPIEVFSRLDVDLWEQPVEFWIDGRYDAEQGDAVYSLFSIATRISEAFAIQALHQLGRDGTGVKLYDAITVAGLYNWTDKWELEGTQQISLLDDDSLGWGVLLRRYGHDIVFEIDYEFRAGEGSSLGFSVSPLFGYEPPRIGYVRY